MTPRRELIELSGEDETADRAMGGPFGLPTLTRILGSLVLPKEPVAPGARWETTTHIPTPGEGRPAKVGVKSRLEGRLLDGDRPVSVIHTELQVPVEFGGRRGDTGARGNMGIVLMLEVYEDTGDVRTLTTVRGQGSIDMGRGKLKLRGSIDMGRGKLKLRDIDVNLLLRNASGELLGPLARGE